MKRKMIVFFTALLILTSGLSAWAPLKTSESVRAQDDFYVHVNEEFLKDEKDSESAKPTDRFEMLSNQSEKALQDLVKEILESKEKFPAGSAESALADLYQTAMDEKGRERAGTGPLKPYLDAIRSTTSVKEYLTAVAMIRKELGKSSLLVFVPSPDPQDASKYALFLDDPFLMAKNILPPQTWKRQSKRTLRRC